MTPEEKTRQAALAAEMIKDCYTDGEAEINGRKYKFLAMTHKQRRKVFAYFTKIAPRVSAQDLSFLDSEEFEPVEAVILDAVTLDDSLLSKLGDAHWEKHPGDFVPFMSTALQVISYPFMSAAPTA